MYVCNMYFYYNTGRLYLLAREGKIQLLITNLPRAYVLMECYYYPHEGCNIARRTPLHPPPPTRPALHRVPFVMNSRALLIMIYNGYVFIAVERLPLINKY